MDAANSAYTNSGYSTAPEQYKTMCDTPPGTSLRVPEKLNQIQYTRPERQARREYYQPEKFIREQEA